MTVPATKQIATDRKTFKLQLHAVAAVRIARLIMTDGQVMAFSTMRHFEELTNCIGLQHARSYDPMKMLARGMHDCRRSVKVYNQRIHVATRA
jgi:hypothetical protein